MFDFSVAINGSFRAFGVQAGYQPPAGDAVDCRVILHQGGPLDEATFGSVKLAKESSLIEVRASEVAAPLAGGTFTIVENDNVFEVDADPVRLDPDRSFWTCSVDSFATVLYRISTGSGTTINPPAGSPFKIGADAAVGATALTITGTIPQGRLLPGDTITVGGRTYTVTTATAAASSKFTNVPITPALAASVVTGDVVAPAFACDKPMKALVGGYTTVELAAGANIADRRVVVMHGAFAAATGLSEPSTSHGILMGGKTLFIKAASASYKGGTPWAWELRTST